MSALTTKVVLFADVAGSMELYASQGTRAASSSIGKSLDICQAVVLAEGGRVVKFLGDGILAVFDQSDFAMRAAIEIQRQHESGEIRFKIGIDAGPVIDTASDLFGGAVGVASRLCDKAHKGEIFASRAVIAGTSDNIAKSSQNPVWIKGYTSPISVYSIELDDDAGASTKIVFKQNAIPSRGRISVVHSGVELLIGIERPQISIGRDVDEGRGIDLTVPRSSVSREHALLKWLGGSGFSIHDTSRNGTYIRTRSQEVRQIHRGNIPLDEISWISFGEQLPNHQYDMLFEPVDIEN